MKVDLHTLWDIEIDESRLCEYCTDDSIHLEISYNSDFRNAVFLRKIADFICKHYWVHPKWRTRIVLIVDELNNNAIEYGTLKWGSNLFEFQLVKNTCWNIDIRISVTDAWNGLHAKNAGNMKELRDQHNSKDFSKHHSIRGRGLFLIISRLVDSLEFEDVDKKGLKVIVTKSLQVHSDS